MKDCRLTAIDVGRGLAAICVFVYHYGVGAILAKITGWSPLKELAWPGAFVAVPLFFVISGFCIHLPAAKQDPSFAPRRDWLLSFSLRRFLRIYPPLVFAVLVSATAMWLTRRETPTAREWLTHLTLTNGFFSDYRLNVVLWTISVEAWLYALYPLWLLARRRFGLIAATTSAVIASAASNLVISWHATATGGPEQWFFVNVWSGWIAGAVLCEYCVRSPDGVPRQIWWWVTGVLAWGSHACLIALHAYTGAWAFARLPILITISVWPLAALLFVGQWLSVRPRFLLAPIWRGLAFIGTFSYSLYLLHSPLIALRDPFDRFFLQSAPAHALYHLAWFGLVLAVSWVAYRLVELPFISLARRVSQRM